MSTRFLAFYCLAVLVMLTAAFFQNWSTQTAANPVSAVEQVSSPGSEDEPDEANDQTVNENPTLETDVTPSEPESKEEDSDDLVDSSN
ncbi:MAG: hypothetical protein AAGA30_12700, partial [Planctomycetota bacterium]